ncbi:MAG: hypothetical protein HC907_23740 [Richelia sp. SM1_7_0]|nr:hypothetical protein [Richelia sp. SM1_7_0]
MNLSNTLKSKSAESCGSRKIIYPSRNLKYRTQLYLGGDGNIIIGWLINFQMVRK